jgi:hypothetical protein
VRWFLWILAGVLIHGIGACGGEVPEARPQSKTGALESGAPDVILFVLAHMSPEGVRGLTVGPEAAQVLGSPALDDGVVFSAAYARFPDPAYALGDLLSLGLPLRPSRVSQAPEDSHRFGILGQGGYSTALVSNQKLAGYLTETSESPRFALVYLSSMIEWVAARDVLREAPKVPGRGRLTIWTALPAADPSEPLTQDQLRVPLVFSLPGILPEKQFHTQVVSLADVGVTLLDLCGLLGEFTVPRDSEGHSFARILQKKPLAWRGFVLAWNSRGAAWIRTTRWRLVRQPDGQETLSFVEKNPRSTRDDLDLPGAAAQKEGLGRRLLSLPE